MNLEAMVRCDVMMIKALHGIEITRECVSRNHSSTISMIREEMVYTRMIGFKTQTLWETDLTEGSFKSHD